MYGLEKVVKNLRISNIKLQETIKDFVNKSGTPKSPSKLVHRASRKSMSRSIGGVRQSTPMKGTEINDYFIVKHLNKLENYVKDYDIIQETKKNNIQRELRKLSIKRLKMVSKYRKVSDSEFPEVSNESDYSQEFEENDAKLAIPPIKLNQTLDMSSIEEATNLKIESTKSRKDNNNSFLKIKEKSGTPIKKVVLVNNQ